jgi:hypothetical protein
MTAVIWHSCENPAGRTNQFSKLKFTHTDYRGVANLYNFLDTHGFGETDRHEKEWLIIHLDVS